MGFYSGLVIIDKKDVFPELVEFSNIDMNLGIILQRDQIRKLKSAMYKHVEPRFRPYETYYYNDKGEEVENENDDVRQFDHIMIDPFNVFFLNNAGKAKELIKVSDIDMENTKKQYLMYSEDQEKRHLEYLKKCNQSVEEKEFIEPSTCIEYMLDKSNNLVELYDLNFDAMFDKVIKQLDPEDYVLYVELKD